MDAADPRPALLDALRQHGHHATSFQLLEDGYAYWRDATTDTVIAYVEVGRWRVVAGEPVGPRQALGPAAAAFVAESRAARRKVAFFSVEHPFADALLAASPPGGVGLLPIGEQPEWDPRGWSVAGPERRTLRAQVNRARNKGVSVRRLAPAELAAAGDMRAAVEDVMRAWLGGRSMSPMRFLVDLQPFHLPGERRYYAAEREGALVGFLACVPVYARRGWFCEDLLRVGHAPNGTVELLVHHALDDARAAGNEYLTLGLAPLAGVDGRAGQARQLRRALRFFYQRAGPLYGFQSLRRFKERFRPDRWTVQHLAACPAPAGVAALRAVLAAFGGGDMTAFAADTARRLLRRLRP